MRQFWAVSYPEWDELLVHTEAGPPNEHGIRAFRNSISMTKDEFIKWLGGDDDD